MRTLTLRRPIAPIALVATLLAAFLVLFAWPQPAAAHDSLVSSDPAADSTIETLPGELTLTFSAALIGGEGSTEVVVLDAAGNSVSDGTAAVDGAMVIQKLVPEADAGEYHVLWRVVSSDGHPTDGEFGFTVETSSLSGPTEPSTAPSDEASTAPEETSESVATQEPGAPDGSPATAWIWVISIIGVLVVAGIVTWLIIRSRKRTDETDSDTPAER